MKSLTLVFALALSPVLVASLGACERTVAEHQRTSRTWNGDLKTERTTVRERPDGTTVQEHEQYRVRD